MSRTVTREDPEEQQGRLTLAQAYQSAIDAAKKSGVQSAISSLNESYSRFTREGNAQAAQKINSALLDMTSINYTKKQAIEFLEGKLAQAPKDSKPAPTVAQPAAPVVAPPTVGFIKPVLPTPEPLEEEKAPVSKHYTWTEKERLSGFMSDFVSAAEAMQDYRDWNNPDGYVDLAAKAAKSLRGISQKNLSAPEANQERGALQRMLERMIEYKVLTAADFSAAGGAVDYEAFFKSSAQRNRVADAVEKFGLEVSRNLVKLNMIDNALHEFVFMGRSDLGNYIHGFRNFAFDGTPKNALEFALLVYSGQNLTKERYFSLTDQFLDKPQDLKQRHAELARTNSPAAGELLLGRISVAAAKLDFDNGNFPAGTLETNVWGISRKPYSMLAIDQAVRTLSSPDCPITMVNVREPSNIMGADEAIRAYDTLVSAYTSLDYAINNNGVRGFPFEENYNNALREIGESLEKLSLAIPQDDQVNTEALKKLNAGYALFSSPDYTAEKIQEIMSDPAKIEQAVLIVKTLAEMKEGLEVLGNVMYGANPARDLIAAGASMPQGAMHQLFSQKELLGQIYPDASLNYLRIRAEIISAVLSDLALIHDSIPAIYAHESMKDYLDEAAKAGLFNSRTMTRMLNEYMERTETGEILLRMNRLTDRIDPLFARRTESVLDRVADIMAHPFYGDLGAMPRIPRLNFNDFTDIYANMESQNATVNRFLDADLAPLQIRAMLFENLHRKYGPDPKNVIGMLADIRNRIIDKKVPPPGVFENVSQVTGAGDYAEIEQQEGYKGGWGTAEMKNRPASRTRVSAQRETREPTDISESSHHRYEVAMNQYDMGATVRKLTGFYETFRNAQPGQTLGKFKIQSLTKQENAEINMGVGAGKEVLFWVNHRREEKTPALESGKIANPSEDRVHGRFLYRVGGTSWAEAIVYDKELLKELSTLAGEASGEKLNRLTNAFAAGATTVWGADVTAGVQQSRDVKHEGSTNIERTDRGVFIGIGYGNFGIVGVRTPDRQGAGEARYAGLQWEASLSYYSIAESRLSLTDVAGVQQRYNVRDPREGVDWTRKIPERTEVGAGDVAYSFGGNLDDYTKGIFKAGLVVGSKFAGGNVGFQNSDMLLSGAGYASWGLGGGAQSAGIYDVHGKFIPIKTEFFGQHRRFGGGSSQTQAGVGTQIGNIQVQAMGAMYDPRRYEADFASRRSLLDFDNLSRAYKEFQTAQNSQSRTTRRNAEKRMGDALQTFLRASETYSPLQQLGNGTLNELTIKAVDTKGEFRGIITISAVKDPDGKKTTYVANYIEPSKNVAFVSMFDLGGIVEDAQLKKTKVRAVGAVVTIENFRSLMILEKDPRLSDQLAAEAAMAWRGKGMYGMISGFDAGTAYRMQLNVGTDRFDVAFIAGGMSKKDEEVKYHGAKATYYIDNEFRVALGIGKEMFQAATGSPSTTFIELEAGYQVPGMGTTAGVRHMTGVVDGVQVYGTFKKFF